MIEYETSITAHSGADHTPDNSIEFVRYALESDADILEVDVRRDAKHDELVLSHDEVGGELLTLEQAFQLLAGHPSMQINCDLKEAGLEEPVYRLAEQMQLSDRLIFSGSVDPERAAQVLGQKREKIYLNMEEQIPDLYQNCQQDSAYARTAAERICTICEAYGIKTVNVYEGLVDDRFLEIMNRHKIFLSVWTVNEERRLAYFLSRGVYNITTRRLKAALFMRRKRGGLS